ncbi:hypothetical protein V6L77_01465 [Pannonibacter sp. Pt2-lr]
MSVSLVVWGLVIYVLVSFIVAYISRTGQSASMSDYFIGGRSMGGVLSALSYSATTYSAFMMIGLAGLTFKGGAGALGFEIVYFAGVSLVAIFGPRFWAVGKNTASSRPMKCWARATAAAGWPWRPVSSASCSSFLIRQCSCRAWAICCPA